MCLGGISTGLKVDDFVRSTVLRFSCLRSFWQVSPLSSFSSTCGSWTRQGYMDRRFPQLMLPTTNFLLLQQAAQQAYTRSPPFSRTRKTLARNGKP